MLYRALVALAATVVSLYGQIITTLAGGGPMGGPALSDPEPAGFAYWTSVLNSGAPLANVVSAFINSAEYLLHF